MSSTVRHPSYLYKSCYRLLELAVNGARRGGKGERGEGGWSWRRSCRMFSTVSQAVSPNLFWASRIGCSLLKCVKRSIRNLSCCCLFPQNLNYCCSEDFHCCVSQAILFCLGWLFIDLFIIYLFSFRPFIQPFNYSWRGWIGDEWQDLLTFLFPTGFFLLFRLHIFSHFLL